MTKLEFIKKEIKSCREKIRDYKYRGMSKFLIKQQENRLKTLNQIKTDLEAWYIIKDALELTENEFGEEIEMNVFFTNAKVECNDTRKEFKKLKKALELEEKEDE